MPIAVGERLEYATFEIGPWMGGGDRVAHIVGNVVAADAEDIGLDSRGDKSDLGVEKLGNARRGVQCDGKPDLAHGRIVEAAVAQELLRRIGAVDLEAQSRISVDHRQADVMEHRPGVQQFEVGVEASPLTLQRAEQEHTSGVVEQQIVLDVSDERRVWYRDTRDRLRCHAFSVGRGDRPGSVSDEPRFPQKATYGVYMSADMSADRAVVFVVFDGMKLLDVAGPAEVFAEANRFGGSYRVVMASVDGEDVLTSVGSRMAVAASISSVESADTAVVSGGDDLVGRPIDPRLVDAVAGLRPRVRRMASICTGSFILAQTGMLDGRRATTHWRHTGLLSRAYPRISVEPDAIFVRDGDIYTSAGVSAGIDLALALVEADHGADLVREVARSLVVYLKRAGGQSQFSALVEAQAPRRPQLRELTEAIAANPGANHTVKTLAAQASLSSRQLTRLFHAELGTTPARYVEMIRIDSARFGSAETLRRVFVREFGISPKAYRDRFKSTG
jgi:transcriptional regulator GlxA family with amidase domain